MSVETMESNRPWAVLGSVSGWVWGALAALVCALLSPASGTDLDDVFYIDMVHHLVTNGTFAIADNGGVAGAPTLERYFAEDIGGKAMPQYPSGYAVLAAPFYLLFGVNGLILLSAFSFVALLWFTRRIASRLFDDPWVANASVILVGAASFAPAYALAVRPQLLTILLCAAGVERLLVGADKLRARDGGLLDAFLGGLVLASALNIRADAVLALPPALIWLRVFGAPCHRLGALAFVLGMVPSLLIAATINYMKFGVFLPISYGPVEPGFADVGRYSRIFALMGLGFVALLSLDLSKPWVRRLGEGLIRPQALVAVIVLAAGFVALSPAARTYLFNFYVLVVDLQQLDQVYWRLAVVDGFIDFWGYRKFALLQSMPYAVLAVLGLVAVFRGHQVRALTLCFGMISTPILFFAINQWHGGGSLSMRYFLLAVPFLGIVCAWALRELRVHELFDRSWLGRLVAGGLAIILVGQLVVGALPVPADRWFQYYAPLVLAAGLAGLLVTRIWLTSRRHLAAASACVAIGATGAITLEELSMMFGLQQVTHQRTVEVAAAFPPGSLVVAISENEMANASRQGVHILSSRVTEADTQQQAIAAFEAAGRCVFVYRGGAEELFAEREILSFTTQAYSDRPDVWVPIGQDASCHDGLTPWVKPLSDAAT